jgi:hypothetical protein
MATKPENPQRVLLVFWRNSWLFGLVPLKARVPWRFIHSLRDARFCVSTCRRNEKNAAVTFGFTSIPWALRSKGEFRLRRDRCNSPLPGGDCLVLRSGSCPHEPWTTGQFFRADTPSAMQAPGSAPTVSTKPYPSARGCILLPSSFLLFTSFPASRSYPRERA